MGNKNKQNSSDIPRKSFNRTKNAQDSLRKKLIKYSKEDKVLYNEKEDSHFFTFHNIWANATQGWGETFTCNSIQGWEGISISRLKAKVCYLDSEEIKIDLPNTAEYDDPVYRIGELWWILLMELEKKVFDRALNRIIGKSPERDEHVSPEKKTV